jgi:putative DNA primase/helicase
MTNKSPRSVAEIQRALERDAELLRRAGEKFFGEPDVDGARLLYDVEQFVSRFVILQPSALLPVALWTIGTHLFESFETFPYITLLSPEKGCGKTRTTEVIELLAADPVRAICISEAALFRLIEAKRPTLILDEAEILAGKGERADAVRALLNAGNRTGTMVPRCVGQSHELQFFSVFCPKVVCAIRVCPETVKDRSIVIHMQRKRPTDTVGRFILRRVRPEAEALQERIACFALSNVSAIKYAYERLQVDFLGDRDLENFEPLFALLTVTDPSRLEELRAAAEELTGRKAAAAQDDSLSLRLLTDIRAIWPEGETRMLTRNLLARLREIPEAPWQEECPLNERKLARFLAPYNVHPGEVREQLSGEKGKGYKLEQLGDAFARYLTPIRDKSDNLHEH